MYLGRVSDGKQQGFVPEGFCSGPSSSPLEPLRAAPGAAPGSQAAAALCLLRLTPAEPHGSIVKQINSPLHWEIAVLLGRFGSSSEESSCSQTHRPFLFLLPGLSCM